MATKDYIIIIGCGRLGSILAGQLSSEGKQVVVVDNNEEAFNELPRTFSGFTVTGSVVEPHVLKEAGIEKATHVFSTTRDDNVNLMVAQVADAIYKVEHVIARVHDLNHRDLYKEFDVQTVCPTELSADAFIGHI